MKTKAVSISKSFVPDFLTNNNIKEGEWDKFFPDIVDISIGEPMVEFISNYYNVSAQTEEFMFFYYTS